MQLTPITTTIGSEVSGVDLCADLTATLGEQIHDALVERAVLVFRDQPIDPQTHLDLAAALGEVGATHPLYPSVTGFPQVNIIPNDAAHPPESEVWHSDLSCKANPPFAAVLRAELIPPVGGDTLWVDMRAACTALPDELRAQVVDRRAFHSLAHGFRFLEGYGHTDRQRSLSTTSDDTTAEHPVIVRHPVSGREVLYVNESFTERMVGMGDAAGAAVLERLFALARQPRFQMRLRWRRNTVVIWDNWATQHFASGDHYPMYDREMQRVTVASSRRGGLFSNQPAPERR